MWKAIANFFRRLFGEDDRVYHPNTEKPEIPEFNSLKHMLHYPGAHAQPRLRTQGKYRTGYPEGIVIHYSAGHNAPQNVLHDFNTREIVAIVIEGNGTVYQGFPLDEWGYHAGRSSWGGFYGTLNDDFVAIEVLSMGKLEPNPNNRGYHSWFGRNVPPGDTRTYMANTANVKCGTYHKFTDEQEKALIDLVVWLVKNSNGKIKIDNIVGHDEISPGRKTDPGGALSMTMPEFRNRIRKKVMED